LVWQSGLELGADGKSPVNNEKSHLQPIVSKTIAWWNCS